MIYWFVNQTRTDKIRGDLRILEILIEKEKQAYENLGDPAVFLNVHDQEKEEKSIAELMASGESAEVVETQLDENAENAQKEGTEWWMDLFQSEEIPNLDENDVLAEDEVRFFESDWHFFKTGLQELNAQGQMVQSSVDEQNKTVTITAPKDLQERLRQIPSEARSTNNQYNLTTRVDLLEKSIDQARQARAGENTWPDLHYLWPQHPIVEWLVDRLATRFGRHEAPVLRSANLEPGEKAFILMAIIPNKKGQPLLVDWQVSCRKQSQEFKLIPLKSFVERLELKAGKIPNPGDEKVPEALKKSLPEAVEVMKRNMVLRQKEFSTSMNQRLEKKLSALKTLQERQFEQLELKLELSKQDDGIKNSKRQNRILEINQVFDDYREWVTNTLKTEPDPHIQVLAAFCSQND